MRSLSTQHISDLSQIYVDDIELVNLQRPSAALTGVTQKLLSSRTPIQLRWEQECQDFEATRRALGSSLCEELQELLCQEVELMGEVLEELFGVKKVGIRLATINRPMCPRFHVDQVACRLLFTIQGPGTEWIPNLDVEETLFADKQSKVVPLKPGGQVKQVDTGCWSLLKGGKWQEPFEGIVHRSPNTTEPRLLLSVDPIFDV